MTMTIEDQRELHASLQAAQDCALTAGEQAQRAIRAADKAHQHVTHVRGLLVRLAEPADVEVAS